MEKGVLPTPFLITQNPPPMTHYPKPNSPQPPALWAVGLRYWVMGTGFWVFKDGGEGGSHSLVADCPRPFPRTHHPVPITPSPIAHNPQRSGLLA